MPVLYSSQEILHPHLNSSINIKNLISYPTIWEKWVVLYFYPKDDTPGCTTEACQFRDDIFKIHALNAEVLGVSLDSAESHTKFAKKYGLPFPLLSDAETVTAEKYGCLSSLGPFKFAKRHTFIINPEGKLVKIYQHSEEIIAELTRLQSQ